MSDYAKTMLFGKYQGIPVEDVPKDYLRWLVKNVKLKPFLAGAVHQALGIEYHRKHSLQVPSVELIGRDYVKSDDTSCPFDCD